MPASIGVNMRVTGHYSQGSRKHMEDKFSVAYQQTEDERDLEYAYFGIFDGHGGCEAAAYAKDHLMEAIVRQKHFWSDDDADVLRAIRNGYMITHMNMWKELEKWPKEIHGLPSTAGTTATVAFIRRGKIYVGHVGDSAIALGYQVDGCDKWKALPLTVDHKPESEAEMQRIVECGGKVMVKAGISRVVWSRYVIGNGKLCHQEIPFLAIARSLGDHWSYNTNSDEFVVSPDPDVGVVPIDPSKFRCLIFGTDGLWNMISPREAVESVQEAQRHNEEVAAGIQSPDSWQNPSKGLVDSAIKRWANIKLQADNTTVVTVMMDPPGPPRSRAPVPPAPLRTGENSNTSTGNSQSEKNSNLSNTAHERNTGEMSSRPINRTSTVPLPPVTNIPQYSSSSNIGPSLQTDDEENVVNNYGNPSESYFIARLLNKTQIRNSLQHVYDEILKSNVEVPNQPQESEKVINNNNNVPETESTIKNSIQQIAPVTTVESGESHQNESSDNKPFIDDKTVEVSVENEDDKLEESEQESIQINEVSSSSPVDSIPKLRKRKPKNLSTGDAVQNPPRNLRSHDTTPVLKPQTRFSDKNRLITPKRNLDSKVPVPVHSKSTSSKKLVITQPKPKTFQCSATPGKTTPTVKLEKKNTEKANIKNQKPITILAKDDKVDLKPKQMQPKSELDSVTNVSNTRMTRSKDSQVPSTESPSKATKNASKFNLSEDNPKSASTNVPTEKSKTNPRLHTSLRHKSIGLTFCSPRTTLKGRAGSQVLESNVECFKENLSASSPCQTSSKAAKRRNSNVGHTLEQEPKEKRRTRLGDKRGLSAEKLVQEQHHDVSSTETFKNSGFILGLQVCNDVSCNSESSSQNCVPAIEDSTNYVEGLHQKPKPRNKKDCKFVKGVLSDDILSEVHSTTLNLENDSLATKKGNESAIRALRPRHDAQQSLGRKVSDKRVLRSSICTLESSEKRPILKLKNNTIPSKGVLRKRAAWPQTVRPGLRKRFSK